VNTEFDSFAASYGGLIENAIKFSGEKPDFFAEYKIAELRKLCKKSGIAPRKILDFGSGTGSSIPWFRKYFPEASLICSDVSKQSLDLSLRIYQGREEYLLIDRMGIPLLEQSVDIVFTACVFHHITNSERSFWFNELYRVLRQGGMLVIFEHNPVNPITLRIVRDCPLDINAELIKAADLKNGISDTGFKDIKVNYKLFFPKWLSVFRTLESWLVRVPLGAQYVLTGFK
jgi:SAM-dependent methyltransferase